MRVVICTDGSAGASAGSALLARLRLPADTEVMVLAVLESGAPFGLGSDVAEDEQAVLTEIQKSQLEAAEGWVDREADSCLKAGWAVRTSTPAGVASEVILETISEFEADLVVVGARGSGGSNRGSLGRTARRVVKHALCGVLVVRPPLVDEEAEADPAAAEAPLQILVAYDGSAPARAAIDALVNLPLGESAEVTLLTVLTVSTTLYGHDILQRMSETWKEHKRIAAEELAEAEARLREVTPNVSARILDGGTNATDEILDAATLVGADLVMVGRTGKSGLERFLLGSVCGEIVDSASCSVWVTTSEA